jgi:hypothetical protein
MVMAEGAKNTSDQRPLPGFGPDYGDEFRFTWWNTQVGDPVWIEDRGRWRPGVVKGLGREFVQVEIESRDGRRLRVSRRYTELRRMI